MNEQDLRNNGWVKVGGEWFRSPDLNRIRANFDEQHPPLASNVPRKEKSGKRFAIHFTIFAVRPCDWDNYFIKPLQDCIRAAGLIPDDDWKTLEGKVTTCKARNKSEERTEIEITPL